jgi:hypothetical protein
MPGSVSSGLDIFVLRRSCFMKKMAFALLGVMLSATAAHAEHKLLITDVLDAKQVEAQARFEYSRITGDANASESPWYMSPKDGSFASSTTESLYSLGVGLGHGLEVTAAVPYLFNERRTVDILTLSETEKHHGIGDFAIEAKYRLLGGEEQRYAVVTGLDVKFDTAGQKKGGTGTTDVSPFIAASTNLGHHFIPYGIYRATIRSHDAADTHTLSAGVEKELNDVVTLDAKIDANFNTATAEVSGFEDFSFELTSYIRVVHNFYLLPTAAYLVSTDANSNNVPLFSRIINGSHVTGSVKSVDGYRVGCSLYYLF